MPTACYATHCVCVCVCVCVFIKRKKTIRVERAIMLMERITSVPITIRSTTSCRDNARYVQTSVSRPPEICPKRRAVWLGVTRTKTPDGYPGVASTVGAATAAVASVEGGLGAGGRAIGALFGITAPAADSETGTRFSLDLGGLSSHAGGGGATTSSRELVSPSGARDPTGGPWLASITRWKSHFGVPCVICSRVR